MASRWVRLTLSRAHNPDITLVRLSYHADLTGGSHRETNRRSYLLTKQRPGPGSVCDRPRFDIMVSEHDWSGSG